MPLPQQLKHGANTRTAYKSPLYAPSTCRVAVDYGHTYYRALYKVLVFSVCIARMLLMHAIVYPTSKLYVLYAYAIIKQLSAMHINYCCLP